MAQHDYVIANQGFPAFRADLNSALSAVVSNNSGSSAPSTTYAYQLWYDTGNNQWKMRNADNDAFITLATFNQTTDTVNNLTVWCIIFLFFNIDIIYPNPGKKIITYNIKNHV